MSDNRTSLAVIPRSGEELQTFARTLRNSGLLPADLRGKEPELFMTIAAGLELGIPPIAAIRGIAIIKGKPTMHADLIAGIVRGSGRCQYLRRTEYTDAAVTWVTKRVGEHEVEVSERFTIEDAKRAGLAGNGGNYQKYPRRMLNARALAFLCRDVYPDCLHGVLEAGEAAEVHGAGSLPPRMRDDDSGIVEAEIVDSRSPEHEPPAATTADGPPADFDEIVEAMRAADCMDALYAAARRVTGYPDGQWREELRGVYQQQRARIGVGVEAE